MYISIFVTFVNVIFFLNGLLPFENSNRQFFNISYEPGEQIPRKFDRIVIMIVDAIRTDFVNDNFMPLTSKLLNEHGCLINVSVASPTVTLPRIKSFITGSIPQFMDVVHNLGNPQVLEDSLLHQAKKRNKRVVFYGDDTWLKIFPNNMFLRHDGTTSFYVSDFYEVDNNVTKHLTLELTQNDWDIMILHYLGLDHIGHVHGPFSPLIPRKLHEMDKILSRIFESISVKNLSTLTILTGDHGMRDTGGHGGSTYWETRVPFAILGMKCDDGLMDQVDITPNLSVLLGLEIPSTSIGKLTPLLLKNLSLNQYVSALFLNAQFLSQKHGKADSEFLSISGIYEEYLKNRDAQTAVYLTKILTEYSDRVSRLLIKASTQQNIIGMIVSVIFLCYSLISHLKGSELFKTPFYNFIFYILLLTFRIFSKDLIVLVAVLLAMFFQLFRVSRFKEEKRVCVILFFIFLQPISWFSSSFIEEEHEFWYFIMKTFLVVNVLEKIKEKNFASSMSWLFIVLIFRFAETLNQMGDKWSSLPDSSKFLNKPENYYFLLFSICSSVSSIYFCFKLKKNVFHLDKIILFLVFIYKIEITNQIILARVIYFLLLLFTVFVSDFFNVWVLLITFLAKSTNLCLIPLCIFTSRQISNDFESDTLSICLHLILMKCLYFMQGTGNTIASIDVAVGYTALTDYFPVLVGLQLFIYTYSTTILIHLLLLKSVKNKKTLNLLYTERLFTTLIVCFVSMIFRNHIFIWTVYAPKLCIECCHTVVFLVEFLLYLLLSSGFRYKIK